MMMIASAAVLMTLTSCIKDEPLNNECDITSAWVEGDEYKVYFDNPTQMHVDNISSTEKEIVFTVRSTVSLSKQIPVNFTMTDGATIEPANGSMQDFTAGPVTYTVTSQDGQWKRQYTVVFKEPILPSYKFSFEHVETVESSNKCSYHEFYEETEETGRQNIWASGNRGAQMTIAYASKPEAFPTYSTPDGYQGKGVCLQTISTGQLAAILKKPIAAGNLFLGKFLMDSVLVKPLRATQFGILINKEPVRLTGYYKYQPGKEFTDKDMKVVPGRVDEADIYAVFYRNKDSEGNDVWLYGDDVLTSPLIVSKAVVKSLPATNEWTRFEAFFEGADADPAIMAKNGYNLALVFSSSKAGATFEGAVGSVLYVDEVEVSFEKE